MRSWRPAITARMIQRYVIARKKDKCKIKGTPIANATVNRDLASLKHMLHKAEIWGYVETSPGRRVENLRDDGSVRTDYYTEEQLKFLVSTAAETRGVHPLNFNDWPEFIVLDANTGLRCKEMHFLEKYYAHLAPSNLTSAVNRLHKENLLPKTDFAPFSGIENREPEVPLTDSFERCYVPEVALLAGVAKLAYAADSKSAGT